MPKIIEEPTPKKTLQYEQCGDYVLIETARKFGIISVDDFNKCKLDYNKILKKVNESDIFLATDELLEHYSKYGFFQIYNGCKSWLEETSYIHFGENFNGSIFIEKLKEAVEKYKSSGYKNFVIKKDDVLVGIENRKCLKRPVQVNDYYEDPMGNYSRFALQSNNMVPLYDDPASCDDWQGYCQYKYLNDHEISESDLRIIFYYPTDEEWDSFLNSDKNESDFFYPIIDQQFNEWLLNMNPEDIKKQRKDNLEIVKNKIINSLIQDYELSYEDDNKIIVNLEPNKIIININDRL